MNPTDELCRMLGERSEPYIRHSDGMVTWRYYSDGMVTWCYYSDQHSAVETLYGKLQVTGITPEQAIAATLGDADLTAENAELRRACSELRWMLGTDRCLRCDRVCEDLGRCPLDEQLASLGVTVPLRHEVGHVSQCKEEDEQG